MPIMNNPAGPRKVTSLLVNGLITHMSVFEGVRGGDGY